MRLYVCWGTFPVPWPRRADSWHPNRHPCKIAHDALRVAGHAPEVVKVYGFRELPVLTRGRREVRRLTGDTVVPVLASDDGDIVKGSANIANWAGANRLAR